MGSCVLSECPLGCPRCEASLGGWGGGTREVSALKSLIFD